MEDVNTAPDPCQQQEGARQKRDCKQKEMTNRWRKGKRRRRKKKQENKRRILKKKAKKTKMKKKPKKKKEEQNGEHACLYIMYMCDLA